MPDARDDPEGEALAAEIAADRRAARDSRRRWILYVPPLAALGLAAAALALSHPRQVVAARVIGGGLPPAGQPLSARVIVLRVAGLDATTETPLSDVELRIGGEGAHGRVTTSDEEGVAELTIEPPLPARAELEGKLGAGWSPLATIALESLPPTDPTDGAITTKRTYGQSTGELLVDVAPELGALDPQEEGAAWVRVRRKTTGEPVADARVLTRSEAGLLDDPLPTVTDDAGLARVPLRASAPPVIVVVEARKDARVGEWRGALGLVLGVPAPHAYRVAPDVGAVALFAPTTIRVAYYDVWREGLRVAGGRALFDHGTATVPLPHVTGLFDVEVARGPMPALGDDLVHAATWPVVVAADAPDAWVQLVPPRVPDRIAPPLGGIGIYEACVAASLARAPVVLPRRSVFADGLPVAAEREQSRVHRVRRGAAFAIVGGGFVEFGLMLWLGVLGSKRKVDEELRAIAEAEELALATVPPPQSHGPGAVRTAAIVVTAIGIVALVFAALAVMAWGLPALS